MTNAIVVRRELTRVDWEIAKEFGEYAARSGIGNQFDSALKAYAAKELGLSSIAGLKGIHIIDGTPTLAPKLAWGKILQHPEFDGYVEKRLTDEQGNFFGWRITLSRKNGITQSRQFTLDDARRVEYKPKKFLADKKNYREYPENVTYWRAMGFVQDVVFPDVTLGLYRADELGANITSEGDMIPENDPAIQYHYDNVKQNDVVLNWNTVEPISDEPAVPDYGKDLSWLLENVDEADILAANDGEFPVTSEQVNRTIHELIKASMLADPLGVSDASEPKS
jgi:hypothetical protein